MNLAIARNVIDMHYICHCKNLTRKNNMKMEYKIVHNESKSRFEATINESVIGLVDYELAGGIMTVPHTEVNTEYEGQGIAGALTKKLLEYAISNNYKIHPICPYTKAYIERHPEYSSLIAR